MLTLSKNQKYILEELAATFVSAFIKSGEDPAGSHRVRIVSDEDNEVILAEVSDTDEQKALDSAIEEARLGAGVNDHKIGEKEALEIRLTNQQKQIDALLEQNKKLLALLPSDNAPEPESTGIAIPAATLPPPPPPPPPIKNKGGRPPKNKPTPEPSGPTDDGN